MNYDQNEFRDHHYIFLCVTVAIANILMVVWNPICIFSSNLRGQFSFYKQGRRRHGAHHQYLISESHQHKIFHLTCLKRLSVFMGAQKVIILFYISNDKTKYLTKNQKSVDKTKQMTKGVVKRINEKGVTKQNKWQRRQNSTSKVHGQNNTWESRDQE